MDWSELAQPQPLNITLVTVHADDELMGAALEAADRSGWSLHEAHFAHHISARRRPHFASEARRSRRLRGAGGLRCGCGRSGGVGALSAPGVSGAADRGGRLGAG